MPYSWQTLATESRSSTMPKFVVPAVCHDGKKGLRSFSLQYGPQVVSVQALVLITCNPTNSASMTSQADLIEECDPWWAATLVGPGAVEPDFLTP